MSPRVRCQVQLIDGLRLLVDKLGLHQVRVKLVLEKAELKRLVDGVFLAKVLVHALFVLILFARS